MTDPKPGHPDRPRLLLNPTSARGRGAARLVPLLREVALDVREVDGPERMRREARRAVEDGLERVLVAGGDGTLHHAIRALAGSRCALGVVPTGTGNDFARALGLPLDPLRAGLRALRAEPRAVDLGRIDGRPFAGVVGVGIDGEVNRIVQDKIRWPRGSAAYVIGLLAALWSFRAPRITLEYDGGVFSGAVLLAALANSPYFGGGMHIAPRAELDDGRLDLILIEQVPLRTLLAVFPRVYRGHHLGHPAVRTVQVEHARLRSVTPVPAYADGERVGSCGPDGIAVDIWARGLRVLA